MKKVSLLIAMIVFAFSNAFAQMSFDFNDCPAGAKIAQTLGDPWTTWSYAPGSAEDGVFGEAGGSMACHFTYNNDQIVELGDHETGVYDLEFDILVPQGKNAYFNVLHHFTGNPNTCKWAMQVYLHETNDGQNSTAAPGHGTVHAGSNGTADIPAVYDEWMHFRVHVDADNDLAYLYYNVVGQPEQLICQWQWSLDSFGENVVDRVLGAMDFFPPENAATSEFYMDNLSVTLQSNDEVLIFDPFEDYTVGEHIASAALDAGNDWWTTWTNQPGSSEDGYVASQNGTKCGKIDGTADNVLLLGDEENGNYDLEFDILVPEGKNGYFNILHRFAGSNSKWAMQCYLHLTNDGQNSTSAPGHGTIHAGSNNTAELTNLVYDGWMHFRLNVDTDTDVANFYYTAPGEEEVLVCTWQWSLDSFGNNVVGRTLAAMDFFAPMENGTSEYYLDNFSFKKIGGESAPALAITPGAIEENLEVNNMSNVTVTIANDGNSIGDWTGWVDFGQGADGSQIADLMYHNGEYNSGIGSSAAYSRELGIRLTPSMYAGAAMGMKLVSARYYISTYTSTDYNYTFRVYAQGMNDQPGELLAEKTINTTVTEDWITVNFDTPVYLTGQQVWLTVAMEQSAEQYPMSMDSSVNDETCDGNWLSTNGGAFSHCYLAPDATSDGFQGVWMLTAHCQGTTVPGGWASINKNSGSLLGGTSDELVLALNSIGLTAGQIYNANLIFNTNDVDLPHVEIPVTLNVGGVSVAENANEKVSVYPNPASTKVTVEGENLSTVAIYNVAGQLVRIVKLDSAINNIDMNVEAGVYFFSIYDKDGNNMVQRVVITK